MSQKHKEPTGQMLSHLKAHLRGKVIILGIGNSLHCDDAVGSLLASRISNRVAYTVFDTGPTPENYLGRVIREKPDTVVIIDAVDFGAAAGEFRILEGQDIQTVNLFSTHNISISLTINYLQSNLKTDIIVLIIQPKDISFGENLSNEVKETLEKLAKWFLSQV